MIANSQKGEIRNKGVKGRCKILVITWETGTSHRSDIAYKLRMQIHVINKTMDREEQEHWHKISISKVDKA